MSRLVASMLRPEVQRVARTVSRVGLVLMLLLGIVQASYGKPLYLLGVLLILAIYGSIMTTLFLIGWASRTLTTIAIRRHVARGLRKEGWK